MNENVVCFGLVLALSACKPVSQDEAENRFEHSYQPSEIADGEPRICTVELKVDEAALQSGSTVLPDDWVFCDWIDVDSKVLVAAKSSWSTEACSVFEFPAGIEVQKLFHGDLFARPECPKVIGLVTIPTVNNHQTQRGEKQLCALISPRTHS